MKKLIPMVVASALLVGGCGGGDTEVIRGHSIEYVISGISAGSTAFVTYTTTGGVAEQRVMEQREVAIPTTITVPFMFVDSLLYVSARNQTSEGSVSVEIRVDGAPFRRAEATGPYGVATASANCCS